MHKINVVSHIVMQQIYQTPLVFNDTVCHTTQDLSQMHGQVWCPNTIVIKCTQGHHSETTVSWTKTCLQAGSDLSQA